MFPNMWPRRRAPVCLWFYILVANETRLHFSLTFLGSESSSLLTSYPQTDPDGLHVESATVTSRNVKQNGRHAAYFAFILGQCRRSCARLGRKPFFEIDNAAHVDSGKSKRRSTGYRQRTLHATQTLHIKGVGDVWSRLFLPQKNQYREQDTRCALKHRSICRSKHQSGLRKLPTFFTSTKVRNIEETFEHIPPNQPPTPSDIGAQTRQLSHYFYVTIPAAWCLDLTLVINLLIS